MIRKVITTLGIVLLAIGMFSCEDSSTPSGPNFAADSAQTALTAGQISMYSVTLDKAVELIADVALAGKITLVHTRSAAALTPAPTVATAVINTGDTKKIDLTFAAPITFEAGDKLKITIAKDAITDTSTDKVKNSEISVELTVGAATATAPAKAATQASLVAGTGVAAYTVNLNNEVALFEATTDLKGKITLKHVDGANETPITLTTATIKVGDASKIDLVFTGKDFAAGEKLKIVIAADAVKNTSSDATPNAAITIEVTVVAAPAAPAKGTPAALTAANSIAAYTVNLNNEVELVDPNTAGFLKGKITLKHVDGANETPITLTTATIKVGDASKIDLVFTATNFVAGNKLKIVIAAGAIKNTTSDATQNADITIEVAAVAP